MRSASYSGIWSAYSGEGADSVATTRAKGRSLMKSRSPCLVTVETWRICRLDTASSVGRMRSPLRPKARPADGSALALWTESGRAANWLGLLRAAMRAPPMRKVEARPVRIVPQSQRMLTLRRTGVSSSSPTRSGGSDAEVDRVASRPHVQAGPPPHVSPVSPIGALPAKADGATPFKRWPAGGLALPGPQPKPSELPRFEPYFSVPAVFGTNKARLTTLYGLCGNTASRRLAMGGEALPICRRNFFCFEC